MSAILFDCEGANIVTSLSNSYIESPTQKSTGENYKEIAKVSSQEPISMISHDEIVETSSFQSSTNHFSAYQSSGYQSLGYCQSLGNNWRLKIGAGDCRKDKQDRTYETSISVFNTVDPKDTYSEAVTSVYSEMVNLSHKTSST